MVSVAGSSQETFGGDGAFHNLGARRKGVLFGGDSLSSSEGLSSGITFEAGCGNRRVDEVGKRTDRVRLRADHRFCNRRKGSANGRSSTASSEGTKPEQFGKLRQRSRRHTTWSAEKELARAGYFWRTSRKPKEVNKSQSLPSPGQETEKRKVRKGHRTVGARCCAFSGTVGARSSSSFASNATVREHEGQEKAEAQEEQKRFKSKCKQLGKQFGRERFKFQSSSASWTCEGSGDIPVVEEENVSTAAEACAQICARSGERSGGRESCLSSVGDREKDQLGKAKESPTLSLHAVRHPDKVAEGPDRKGHVADSSLFEVNTSGSIGQRLEHCMASVPFAGSMEDQATMGRRSGRSWKRHGIFEEHGRAESKQQIVFEVPAAGQTGDSTDAPGGDKKKKGKGKGKEKDEVKTEWSLVVTQQLLHPSLDRQLRRQFLDGLWCY